MAGLITVDDTEAVWDERRYALDDRQRAVLVTPDDPAHVSPLADMVAGIGQVIDRVAEAYAGEGEGEGVGYAEYGPHFRGGQAAINRPAFSSDLVPVWIGAIPEVAARLAAGGRVADLGCGAGWSTIAVASGFPNAEVIGYDSDPASIAEACSHARDAEVTTRFSVADARNLASDGRFDLVLLLEALHDLAHPVEVLAAAREALAPDGVVMVADELVADRFTAPGDTLERMMYGWSVLHCLPASLAEQGSAGIGTVMRAETVRRLAAAAGFGSVETPEVDAGFFRLYVLRI